MTELSPTRVIGGRYVVLGALGSGRVGPVWRAQDRVTGHQVAVRALPLAAGLDAVDRREFRERLLRAARAAGRVDAPGIVTVHDVVSDDDVDHVVTELVEVPTLAEQLAAGRAPAPPVLTGITRQLAAALGALHDAGVVHGRITPDAVLVGPGPRARLADLGACEVVDGPAVASGSGFSAPEIGAGAAATRESDVWALGATAYYALHGRPPAPAAVASRVGAEGPLAGVLAGMLQPAPEARLTARQVVAQLDAQLAAQPRRQPPHRTAPRVWLAVAVLVALLVAGVVGFLLGRSDLVL